MIPTKAYAAPAAAQPLGPFSFDRREVGPHDVLIEIAFCGVCHSDIHQVKDEWGGSLFPMVPGHEIVGRVARVGDHVKGFKPGDLAGVGCMVDSCRTCPSCARDLEQFCAKGAAFTYNGTEMDRSTRTYGGYSERIVVPEAFVLHISPSLDLAAAAPLLCAGITTYSPLRHWNTRPGDKVGVVGLGGLGHMAVKLASAMGAEVTMLSTSPSKEADARRLGADHIVISADPGQMAAVSGRFHLIIDTVPYVHDLNPYLPVLAKDGTLVLVGYLGALDSFLDTTPLVLRRKSVAGSLIGGIQETQELLDFCGQHGITSDVEVIPMQDINAAYERMLKSDVKYRFVIDMATLKTR